VSIEPLASDKSRPKADASTLGIRLAPDLVQLALNPLNSHHIHDHGADDHPVACVGTWDVCLLHRHASARVRRCQRVPTRAAGTAVAGASITDTVGRGSEGAGTDGQDDAALGRAVGAE